jgi:type IV secretion system protein VirB10
MAGFDASWKVKVCNLLRTSHTGLNKMKDATGCTFMRTWLLTTCLAAIAASAQSAPNPTPAANNVPVPPIQLSIPAGTRVPIALKQAISTKGNQEGDAVYAETTFPVVAPDGRVLIPAGTYVQGRISHVKRGGRIKGKAEVLMHFTTLIYPSGYTVLLPGSVERAPGVDKSSVKDEEGTIKSDSQTGEKVGAIATGAGSGAVIGGVTNGGKGALIGAGVGGAVGTAIAMLTRGNDIKMDAGTTLEMVIQRDVPVDAAQVPANTGKSSR